MSETAPIPSSPQEIEPSAIAETQVIAQTEPIQIALNDNTASEPTIVATQEAAINEVALEEAVRAEILEQLSISPAVEEPPQANPSEIDSNLIDIINSMESDRQKFIAHVRSKISNQETEFEKTKSENDRLKKRVAELEVCLRQNNISIANGTNNSSSGGNKRGNKSNKNDDDDILTQAKTLLFEKTKICKQQEQQLAAYKAQVEATKEVLQVTKDMLCLRNIEHDHTEARLDTMDLKLKNERARQVLSDKKLEVSKKMYADLRAEYDIQSNIFKQLRAGYEEKIAVLTKQIQTLKS